MSTLLYADLTNKKLRRSLGGAEYSFGTIPHIGTIALGLRFSKQVGTRHVEVFPTIHEIRATIGWADLPPETGQFSLKVGGGSAVLGTNLTTLLDYNFTATGLAAALNALSVVGTAVVVEDDGSFVITGITDPITVVANTLRPISFVRVWSYQVNGTTTQAIRLQRAPFAFTDVYDQRVPRAPYVERIQTGGTVDGTVYPEVQKLTVPLEFNGNYRLRRSDPIRKSALLGVADGPEQIAASINPTTDSIVLADDADGVFRVEEHPTDPASLIYFEGSMLGTAPALLEVEVFDPKPGDYWIWLDPDTPMTAEALRETDTIRRVPIEIYADIEDEEDEEKVIPVCLYKGECTVVEAATKSDLATAQNIDWINPPTAKSYLPVSPDSLTEGTRFYEFARLADAAVSFQVTHSFDSPRVRVAIRENAAGGRELVHGTDFEWVHDDDDALTVTLIGDYATTPPALAGTVQDLTLTSTWLDPVDVPIANVTGLQALLDAILEDLATLMAKTSDVTAIGSTVATGGTLTAPLGRVWRVPRARELPEMPGSLMAWRATAEELGELPRRPLRLLPAIHDAATESLPNPLPAPSAVTTPLERVFTTATARDDFPGGLAANDFAACDGREWYRVIRQGTTSTYHPAAMETILFETIVSADEMPLGSRLELLVGFEAMILMLEAKARTRRSLGQYTLLIQAGALTTDSTPGTPGANLKKAFDSPVTLVESRITLTEIPRAHRFGCVITRSSSGTLAADKILYTKQSSTTAPASVPMALRASLVRWDTENDPSDARGIVAVRGLDVGLDGQPDPTLGLLKITS